MNHRHLLPLILIPVLILIMLACIFEGVLRLTPYNRNFVLFSESKTHPGLMELSVKQDHPGTVFSVPFKKNKEKECFRVIISGEPEVAVQPVNPNVSFSHILNSFLQQSFPEKKIEIINLALDSRKYMTQYEAIRQLSSCAADLVLLWPEWNPGNNHRYFTRLRLERFIKDLCCGAKRSTGPGTADSRKHMSHFEKELDKTISFLQDHKIPVIMLNTCSNLDFPPLRSDFTSPVSTVLPELFEKAKTAYLNYNYDIAYSFFSSINRKDRRHAGTCYYLGKLALKNFDPQTARNFLRTAVDNDLEQLRPPSGFQEIIARQSAVHNILFIDTDKIFQLYSKNGIPGSNLFSGPTKPNLAGNIIIARECYRAILKGNFLTEKPKIDPHNLAITPFDTAYDHICSEAGLADCPDEMLLHIPPGLSFEKKTVDLFAAKKISWEDSMNQLYTYYTQNKKYDLAFRIIENLALENPYNISVNNQASITASLTGDSQKVVHYGKKAFAMKPELQTAMRIFIHYLKLDRPSDALPYLEYARKNDSHTLDLIYNATLQIIDLKKQLEHDSLNPEIRKQIAFRYEVIGNDELALWYANPR